MSVSHQVTSDRQLARLLQIGVVLEEVVEARAHHHYQAADAEPDPAVASLLEEAAEESADHRERLETLIAELDAESIPFDEIQALVEAQYAGPDPTDFDGVLYDQLSNEETAYKFYDDLIDAIEDGDAEFSIGRERLLTTLREIRAEEEAGVEEVTELMEAME